MTTCYACDSTATTFEHVPPQCVFPHKKHLPRGAKDLRKNLITVPSCDLHNCGKKVDDEYFGCFVATTADDGLAFEYFTKKWIHNLRKNNDALLSRLLANSKQVILPNGQKTLGLQVETTRLFNCLKSICRGLYYHESKHTKKLLGDNWTFSSPNILNKDLLTPEAFGDPLKLRELFTQASIQGLIGFEARGQNADAFFYQRADNVNGILFRLVFYFRTEFFVLYRQEAVQS